MQINQSALAALFKGYRTQFLEAMHGAKPLWSNLAMRSPSSAASEIYHWLGAMPGMKKLLGEITIANLSAFKYEIFNEEWYDVVGVRQADIERDTYGVYNPKFQALGAAAMEHPDELVANIMATGFTATDYTGSAFFAANKQRGGANDKAPFTNLGTKKLSIDNFTAARTAIKSVKNAEGRPMNLGQKLLLVVSPTNEVLGRQILQADMIAQTAKNTEGSVVASAAVSNVNKGTAELMVWPRLAANPDQWFLLEVGMAIKPFVVQFEKEAQLFALDNVSSDHVFKNHEFLYQAYGRYNAGYGLSELAWGSTGVDAA